MDWPPFRDRPPAALLHQAFAVGAHTQHQARPVEPSRPSHVGTVRPAACSNGARSSDSPLTLPRAGRAAVLAAAVVTGQRRRRRRASRVRVATARSAGGQPPRSSDGQGKEAGQPLGGRGQDPEEEEGLDPDARAPDIEGRQPPKKDTEGWRPSESMGMGDWGDFEQVQGAQYQEDEGLDPDVPDLLGRNPSKRRKPSKRRDDEDWRSSEGMGDGMGMDDWEGLEQVQGVGYEEDDEGDFYEEDDEGDFIEEGFPPGSARQILGGQLQEDEVEYNPKEWWKYEYEDEEEGEEWEDYQQWENVSKAAVKGGTGTRARSLAPDPKDDEEDEEEWPEDEEEWDPTLEYVDQDPFGLGAGGDPDTPGFRKGGVFEGMDDDDDPLESEEPPERISARDLSLLYDDFEITKPSETLVAEIMPKVEGIQKEPPKEKKDLRKRRDLTAERLEEREYMVTAEGIAVRTLPDMRSPRTGEILRQGETFTAVEAVDGEGVDRRLYLRLPKGRGWVFDDEKVFPGAPAVKLVSIGGNIIKEPEVEPLKRPLVAVIGRPNVGKSTLVNKICDIPDVGGCITFPEPGVTRDRTYKEAKHTDDCGETFLFEVIDTGGLIFYDDPDTVNFATEIRTQIDVALREAVAAVMVVDGTVGCVQEDVEIAKYVKKVYEPRGLQIFVAVAKCDRIETMDVLAQEFWTLDLGEPVPVCSLHGRGVWELIDTIVCRGRGGLYPLLERGKEAPPSARENAVSVAMVGKPNAGKSSLFNALTGEQRAITSDIPGTTTDSLDAYLETDNGKVYRFIDTAGIRRHRSIKPGTEWLAVNRAIKAVKRADVALMLLDASEIMTGARAKGLAYWCPDNQHRYIARQIEDKGVACVVVLTKWDAVPNKDSKTLTKFTEAIRANLMGVGQWAHIVPCSALTGQRLKKILEVVDLTLASHEKRVQTQVLNEVVRDCLLWRLPAARGYGRKQGRIYYASQVSSCPPKIMMFCNNPKLFGANYKLYIENKLRQDLGFFGTPIVIEWCKRGERRAVQQAEQWLGPRLAPAVAFR